MNPCVRRLSNYRSFLGTELRGAAALDKRAGWCRAIVSAYPARATFDREEPSERRIRWLGKLG